MPMATPYGGCCFCPRITDKLRITSPFPKAHPCSSVLVRVLRAGSLSYTVSLNLYAFGRASSLYLEKLRPVPLCHSAHHGRGGVKETCLFLPRTATSWLTVQLVPVTTALAAAFVCKKLVAMQVAVLVMVSIAVINAMTRNNLKSQEFICLMCPNHSLS